MVMARLGLTVDILGGGRGSKRSLGLNWELGVRESETYVLLDTFNPSSVMRNFAIYIPSFMYSGLS